MTDFATTARQILDDHLTAPGLAGRVIPQLVLAHEADKREELERFSEWLGASELDVQTGKTDVDYYFEETKAALDTPPDSNGIEKPLTPPTTPLRQNAPGGRDE